MAAEAGAGLQRSQALACMATVCASAGPWAVSLHAGLVVVTHVACRLTRACAGHPS